MRAERIVSEPEGYRRPEQLRATVTPEGHLHLVAPTEKGLKGIVDWSQPIGAVDVMNGQLITTIDRHHFSTPAEVREVDHALSEVAQAQGAGEIVITRAERPFNRRETADLQESGYYRPRTDKLTHLHPHKMIKYLKTG